MSELTVSNEVLATFEPVLKALAPARHKLASVADVAAVRPGYYHSPSGSSVPAILVAVTPGMTPVNAAQLAHELGVPLAVIDATVEEQLAAAGGPQGVSFGLGPASSAFEALLTGDQIPEEFAPPRSGAYEPLEPSALPLVNEKMRVTICVSPEAGWGELKEFLAGTQERLTIGMYQFTAPHVFEAVRDAVVGPGRQLELVLHPTPEPPSKSGTKAKDLREDVLVAMGFPRAAMRFQPACHNKTILIDGKVALFGSHNWSNEGVLTNRDASLIFFDKEVAEYLGEVFEYDWDRLATAKPSPPRVRVAKPGERTPAGFQRVPFSAVFED